MTFIRSLSKFMLELFPLVLATVISAVLVSTLHLTSDTAQARRGATDATAEPIVYVNAMPRINRDPAPTVVAALPPADAEAVAPTETPATAATPVAAVQPTTADAVTPLKATPHPQTATAPAPRERAPRGTVATRASTSVAAKPEPAKVEPALARTDIAKPDPAKPEAAVAHVETAPTLAPPMPIPPMAIVNADLQNAAEPTRIFGMTVPASVVTVGGKVVGVARFPIDVAEVAVPHPLARVGLRIVEKVAGAAGAAISDFGR
jgi:hypothetical protein